MPPRRGDGFAEAVSSPAQINQRFIFGMGGEQGLMIPGLAQLESQAGKSFSIRIANFIFYSHCKFGYVNPGVNHIALKKAKIVYNFGLFECSKVNAYSSGV